VEVFNTVDQAKLFGSTSAERQQAALLASDGTRKQRDKARREATSKLPNKEVAQAQFLTEMKILEAIQAQEDAKSKMKTEASKTSKAKPKPSIGSMFVVPKRKVII
jgi:hypothetical protein